MDHVRLGIVGVGTMGSSHARYLLDGAIKRVKLVALADIDPAAMAPYPDLLHFDSAPALIESGAVDAVLIATPHYAHTTIGMRALKSGLHVLVEKPISVHKADCRRLIAAHTNKKLVFAAMFNQRTDPRYQRIKKMVDDGELGELQRVNWIITDWFRSEAYYASGSWRATWKGEGGGVLLNQCPHNLDLLQWMTGMPARVRAFCSLGKYHNIEVEDEVTAYLEYPNGATGVFVTSTGEAPGANRLEIAGDRGKIVVEGKSVVFVKNDGSVREYSKTTADRFAKPASTTTELPFEGRGSQHQEITQNFVNAILDGTPLIAPAEEGIHSVELANAMLYSSALGKTLSLPINARSYEQFLMGLIRDSKLEKQVSAPSGPVDMSKSFGS